MANRPASLCNLEKDKFIGGQVGFVDTFNWAVRSIDNLEGGMNCEVDWTLPDHPVINVDIPYSLSGGGVNQAVADVHVLSGSTLSVIYTNGNSKADDMYITLSAGG